MLISSPQELIQLYARRTKKQFGQHFLSDPAILSRIAGLASVGEDDDVLEIGPGCGTLTWELLRRGANVTAIEIDRDAAAFLREVAYADEPKFTLLQEDTLKFDLGEVLAKKHWKVVANLPYNVGTEIMFRLAPFGEHIDQMALMFQLEVAKRITATPTSQKAYGSLSLMAQTDFATKLSFTLPPGAFQPPPKVKSAVVHFRPIPGSRIPDATERAYFSKLVRTAFNQRRKTLPNAIKSLNIPKEELIAVLESLEISPKARPETISFELFHALAKALLEHSEAHT